MPVKLVDDHEDYIVRGTLLNNLWRYLRDDKRITPDDQRDLQNLMSLVRGEVMTLTEILASVEAWHDWDTFKPSKGHADRHGYLLVWSRTGNCALVTHIDTLSKGAKWRSLPNGPQEIP